MDLDFSGIATRIRMDPVTLVGGAETAVVALACAPSTRDNALPLGSSSDSRSESDFNELVSLSSSSESAAKCHFPFFPGLTPRLPTGTLGEVGRRGRGESGAGGCFFPSSVFASFASLFWDALAAAVTRSVAKEGDEGNGGIDDELGVERSEGAVNARGIRMGGKTGATSFAFNTNSDASAPVVIVVVAQGGSGGTGEGVECRSFPFDEGHLKKPLFRFGRKRRASDEKLLPRRPLLLSLEFAPLLGEDSAECTDTG